jgi:hypothetical protein
MFELTTRQWDKGTIKGLGWSEDEKLLVVTEDGTVRCYYDLQGDFVPFTLGHVCASNACLPTNEF